MHGHRRFGCCGRRRRAAAYKGPKERKVEAWERAKKADKRISHTAGKKGLKEPLKNEENKETGELQVCERPCERMCVRLCVRLCIRLCI